MKNKIKEKLADITQLTVSTIPEEKTRNAEEYYEWYCQLTKNKNDLDEDGFIELITTSMHTVMTSIFEEFNFLFGGDKNYTITEGVSFFREKIVAINDKSKKVIRSINIRNKYKYNFNTDTFHIVLEENVGSEFVKLIFDKEEKVIND